MAIYIEALAGPYKGEQFYVKLGSQIGRSRGDILLKKDPKVSSVHALVRKNKHGQLVLVDNKSANGIKVQGAKVRKLTLLPGTIFEIGRSVFKITEKEAPPDSPEAAAERLEAWRRVLRTQLPLHLGGVERPTQEIQAFSPMLELRFVQGIQADNPLRLGFGPRQFGSESFDIELEEPSAPPLAFELCPTPAGIEFRTEHPKIVLFNEAPLRSQIVKEGDSIRLGQTVIEIGFVK